MARNAPAASDSTPAGGAPEDAEDAEIQAKFDEAHAKGYVGVSPDPTPRENYTLPGVIAGKPTPETDEQAQADALNPKKVR